MAAISNLHNPWRDALRPASFRGVAFRVEVNARAGGRRGVVHEYPKRNLPYSEDMGRRARRWHVQAYHLGPDYLVLRDRLITALEADGPGTLILPLPYLGEAVQAMVGPYTALESRERGGFCAYEIEFSEAGVPGFATEILETASQIGEAAAELERRVAEGMRT